MCNIRIAFKWPDGNTSKAIFFQVPYSYTLYACNLIGLSEVKWCGPGFWCWTDCVHSRRPVLIRKVVTKTQQRKVNTNKTTKEGSKTCIL